MHAHALVTVYPADDPQNFIITAIRSLEADEITLDFTRGEQLRQALSQAPYLTAVGMAGSVKIQFQLDDAQFLDDAGAPGGPSGGRLSAAVPSRGWRVQRRNTFRVRPPAGDNARVVVRLPHGREAFSRLADLSVGGLALIDSSLEPRPALGAILQHCRIEAGKIAPIPCDLRVVQVEDGVREKQALLVRCEFIAMPQSMSRFVQVYVMDIERRARPAGARP